jgi:hypothetical protein
VRELILWAGVLSNSVVIVFLDAEQVWKDEECLTTVKAHDSVVSALYLEADYLYTGSWDEQIKVHA